MIFHDTTQKVGGVYNWKKREFINLSKYIYFFALATKWFGAWNSRSFEREQALVGKEGQRIDCAWGRGTEEFWRRRGFGTKKWIEEN